MTESQDKVSDSPAVSAQRIRPPRSAQEDFCISAALLICGGLVGLVFPQYANLGETWSLPFIGLGVVISLAAFLGALAGISTLSRHQAVRGLATALALLTI